MKELVVLIMHCVVLISCKNKPQVIVLSFPQIAAEDNQQEHESFSSTKGMMKMAYHYLKKDIMPLLKSINKKSKMLIAQNPERIAVVQEFLEYNVDIASIIFCYDSFFAMLCF